MADEIGKLSSYHADLLPQDKVNMVSDAVSKHQDVAMVGDGVNDTPSPCPCECRNSWVLKVQM